MTLPATAQAIYDLLVADAVISQGLGTYTFTDGAQIPAIAVLFAGEHLPPGTTVEGVEVTITALPNGYGPQLTYSSTILNPTWRIYIAGWQSAATLQAMAQRIIALLPGATATPLQGDPPGEGIGVIDQVVVAWTNPTLSVEA